MILLRRKKHLYSVKNVSDDYVINKYRNAEDAKILSRLLEKQELAETTHLIKDEYVQLSHRGYAVPLKLISKEFLFELVISVLHTYGRRLFYLPDKKDIQTAQTFLSYLAVAHELSKMVSGIENSDKDRLSSVLIERSVIQSVYFLCRKTEVNASTLNDFISICKSRLTKIVNYFEFDVLKVLRDESDLFTAIWVKLIIGCYRNLIKIEKTDKVYKEALEWGENLSEKMKSMKDNTSYPKLVWLLGDLYLATGKILKSEKCFEEILPKHVKITDTILTSERNLKWFERKACISYIRCRMNRSGDTAQSFDADTLQRLEAYKLLFHGYRNELEDLKQMEVILKGRLQSVCSDQ
ncbi:unnamed protein product [Mytilus edulis]|uniref:Uncharacterized protein n=1 Tax=Mytilus edulis TaxID=6550 RepID=A0A8S3PN47_MYTED|nr:unnamed protein product [Mytilus edulis]